MSEVQVHIDHVYQAKCTGGDIYDVIANAEVYRVGYSPMQPITIVYGGGVDVIGEIPAGAMNGINATYTSEFDFVPESVEVFLNGVRQKIIDDYQQIGTTQIQFIASPGINEKILINYKKQ